MILAAQKPSATFLFRREDGRIDKGVWWYGSLRLGGLFAVLTAVGIFLLPYTKHDLSTTPLFTWPIFISYLYLILYLFAIILIGISHYNLSAKRWRDRGKPSAFAGLVPFFAMLAGAVHWLHPQMPDAVPLWMAILADAGFLALLVWMIVELGFLPSKDALDG